MIFDRLTVHKKCEPFFFAMNSFVFGMAAYVLTWWLCKDVFPLLNSRCMLNLPTRSGFWDELQDPTRHLEFFETMTACLASLFLAVAATIFSNRKLHYRFARALGLSKKTGEMDVWGVAMSLPETTFVTLRDVELDLGYDGWIHAFSEDHQTMELFLRDVVVYRSSTSQPFYQIGAMYFKIDPNKIILEFRGMPVTLKYIVEINLNHETEQSESTSTAKRGAAKEGGPEPDAKQSATSSATTTAPKELESTSSQETVIK